MLAAVMVGATDIAVTPFGFLQSGNPEIDHAGLPPDRKRQTR